MYAEPLDAISAIASALRRADPGVPWEVYCHPQTWENTACGFGGVAGQAMTTAYTVVLWDFQAGAHVFHAGRHAYHVERPGKNFREALRNHALPGAAKARAHLSE